jgi:hypothetical protein
MKRIALILTVISHLFEIPKVKHQTVSIANCGRNVRETLIYFFSFKTQNLTGL